MSFAFHRPDSIDAAIAVAREHGASARFLAGGTDLIIQINRRRIAPEHLISLAGLGLDTIGETGSEFVIGAMATHDAVVGHPAFQKQLKALTEASAVVGGRQVRNIATVGGNIVNASPAADLVPVLLTLDATVELRGGAGTRTLPLDRFLVERGRTERRPDEILTAVRFDKPPADSATAFLKAGRRKAMEISVICVAAHLVSDGKARIAIGAAASRTLRVPAAEAIVEKGGRAAFAEAGRIAARQMSPIDDVRASARYRRLLVAAMVERALGICADRIEGKST
ncbi:MAG: xanthine dehydrogenase family protein subunit M [Proteobacteria bacterium]|nr:xanthine dehydrogenase family protein subunit M [Pseudomonadota bacterium]